MKIYCFSQQCVQAGRVVPSTKLEDYRAGQDEQSDDIFEFASGTVDEIGEQALKIVSGEIKASHFDKKCAKNVLEYLN